MKKYIIAFALLLTLSRVLLADDAACTDDIEMRSGELIRFCWEDPPKPGVKLYLYRKTGIATSATRVTQDFNGAFTYVMPQSTTKEFRFYVVAVSVTPTGTVLRYGPASNEVVVRRKK